MSQVIDLDRVRQVREFGTGGLSPNVEAAPRCAPPTFPVYEAGFASGEAMRGLGPIGRHVVLGTNRGDGA